MSPWAARGSALVLLLDDLDDLPLFGEAAELVLAVDELAVQQHVVDTAVSALDGYIGFEGLLEFGRQPVGTRLVVSSLAILDEDNHGALLWGTGAV